MSVTEPDQEKRALLARIAELEASRAQPHGGWGIVGLLNLFPRWMLIAAAIIALPFVTIEVTGLVAKLPSEVVQVMAAAEQAGSNLLALAGKRSSDTAAPAPASDAASTALEKQYAAFRAQQVRVFQALADKGADNAEIIGSLEAYNKEADALAAPDVARMKDAEAFANVLPVAKLTQLALSGEANRFMSQALIEAINAKVAAMPAAEMLDMLHIGEARGQISLVDATAPGGPFDQLAEKLKFTKLQYDGLQDTLQKMIKTQQDRLTYQAVAAKAQADALGAAQQAASAAAKARMDKMSADYQEQLQPTMMHAAKSMAAFGAAFQDLPAAIDRDTAKKAAEKRKQDSKDDDATDKDAATAFNQH